MINEIMKLLLAGSPVQGQSGSNLLPEGHDLSDLYPPTNGHQCDYNRHEEGFSVNNKQIACPLHFKLRENCCSGRSLQQMLEVFSYLVLYFLITVFYL